MSDPLWMPDIQEEKKRLKLLDEFLACKKQFLKREDLGPILKRVQDILKKASMLSYDQEPKYEELANNLKKREQKLCDKLTSRVKSFLRME